MSDKKRPVNSSPELIIPAWPAPANVHAFSTTRDGGVSLSPFDSLNLGLHVGDESAHVRHNRALLPGAEKIQWLQQVHSDQVLTLDSVSSLALTADGSVTFSADVACAIMTADCLPVLFCHNDGRCVAAAHAGWRGLAAGIVENTILSMKGQPEDIMVWLGPAIGPRQFEVGEDVRQAFHVYDSAFIPVPDSDRYLCDLYAITRKKLNKMGVSQVYGGGFCTYTDPERFYSYRRATKRNQKDTGRMVSYIYLS